MSILETFFFVFDADASRLRSGVASATESADGLERSLQAADGKAEKLGENFTAMAKAGASALATVISLVAIKKLTADTTEHTYAVYQQAHAMGVSVESLSKLQQSVVMSGGTAEGATASMEALRSKMVEMARYGGIANGDTFMFKQLGLSAEQMHDSIKDPMIALGALADKFGTLERTAALDLGKKLGLDQGTINLLSQGRRGLDEMMAKQKELGFVTREQAADAVKYKLATAELGIAFNSLSRDVTSALLPSMEWLSKEVEHIVLFFRENPQVATVFFQALAASATLAMLTVGSSVLLAAAPFVLLGGAIALIVDDFKAYKAGQDSLIGEAMEKWPVLGQVFRSVGEIFDMVFKVGILETFKIFRDKLFGYLDEIGEKFPGLARGAQAFKTQFGDPTIKVFGLLIDIVERFVGVIAKIPMGIIDWAGETIAKATGGNYDDINKPVAPGAPSGKSSAKGSEIAKKLEGMGWTKEQAAGMAGSLMQESGGNSGAVNPKSGAYGVGQWLGSRVKDYKLWSGGQDLKGSSLDDQLRFMDYELREGKEKAAGLKLRAAKTAAEAAEVHGTSYERAGASEMNTANRVAYANGIMNDAHLSAGQSQLAAVNSSPVANINSQSYPNNSSRSTSLTMGDTHIHTQATDAGGIFKALDGHFQTHMKNAMDQYDDGVAA